MALWLGWLRAEAQGYSCSCNKIELGVNFRHNLRSYGNTMELGLGWLRAVAHCYNYKYIKIKLWSNFHRNFASSGVKLSWCLDGCARWRKVTNTVANKVELGSNCLRYLQIHLQKY